MTWSLSLYTACYVDDCKLYLSFPLLDVDDAIRNLNKNLKSISRWCCQNFLLINPDKTKLLLVGVPQLLRQLPSVSIQLFGKQIEPVSVSKDLGICIDQSFTYNEQIT